MYPAEHRRVDIKLGHYRVIDLSILSFVNEKISFFYLYQVENNMHELTTFYLYTYKTIFALNNTRWIVINSVNFLH